MARCDITIVFVAVIFAVFIKRLSSGIYLTFYDILFFINFQAITFSLGI